MATLNNGAGKGNPGHRHDGQKDFQQSNQRNPDHIRDNTRDHHYKEHDETLTNDALFESGNPQQGMETDDKDQNVEP